MKKIMGIFIILIVILTVILLLINFFNSKTTTPAPSIPVVTKVIDIPLINGIAVITPENNSLVITGRAVGTMFFEASFPVRFEDDNNIVLADGIAQADGDWMTTSSVPFTAKLTLDKPITHSISGVLIFTKDNPSGLEENDAIINIPALIKI